MTDKPYIVYVKVDAELYTRYREYLYNKGLIVNPVKAHGIQAVNKRILEAGIKKMIGEK